MQQKPHHCHRAELEIFDLLIWQKQITGTRDAASVAHGVRLLWW